MRSMWACAFLTCFLLLEAYNCQVTSESGTTEEGTRFPKGCKLGIPRPPWVEGEPRSGTVSPEDIEKFGVPIEPCETTTEAHSPSPPRQEDSAIAEWFSLWLEQLLAKNAQLGHGLTKDFSLRWEIDENPEIDVVLVGEIADGPGGVGPGGVGPGGVGPGVGPGRKTGYPIQRPWAQFLPWVQPGPGSHWRYPVTGHFLPPRAGGRSSGHIIGPRKYGHEVPRIASTWEVGVGLKELPTGRFDGQHEGLGDHPGGTWWQPGLGPGQTGGGTVQPEGSPGGQPQSGSGGQRDWRTESVLEGNPTTPVTPTGGEQDDNIRFLGTIPNLPQDEQDLFTTPDRYEHGPVTKPSATS